ncbi:hypothetical protein CW304_19105 [Bacillus sp. UFRGS-B20]|nr:hypothetical protein CW304_19105 [Bacillus sp. UFRGS-B20]
MKEVFSAGRVQSALVTTNSPTGEKEIREFQKCNQFYESGHFKYEWNTPYVGKLLQDHNIMKTHQRRSTGKVATMKKHPAHYTKSDSGQKSNKRRRL